MKSYPAKLLLFGEHTVNIGSRALAMPLSLYSGKWKNAKKAGEEAIASHQRQLPGFADYIEKLQSGGELNNLIDLARFREALKSGLYFESNIPIGYGAGSSGALVAAVFDEFGFLSEKMLKLAELRTALAKMESFFHGKSSGTDPLICLLKKPLLLGQDHVEIVELAKPKAGTTLFLLDTGAGRQATPLIEYFLEKSANPDFEVRLKKELLPAVDSAIEAMMHVRWAGFRLGGDLQSRPDFIEDADLFEAFHKIGVFQFHYLDKMIPALFKAIWQDGISSSTFKLKVCGAGGGGFILGMSTDFDVLKNKYPDYRFFPIEFPHEGKSNHVEAPR